MADVDAIAEPLSDAGNDGEALSNEADMEEAEGAADDELAELEAQLYGAADGAPATTTGGESAAAAQPMSKSQMKKLAKQQRYALKKVAQKEKDKEIKAKKKAAAAERRAQDLVGLTEEEKKARKEEAKAKLLAHKDAERALKERMKQSLLDGRRIVIDLDFEGKMNSTDTAHLLQQLGFCYAANKAVAVPAHLVLSSFTGTVAELGLKKISGLANWMVTRSEQHYAELFAAEKDKLVYLTADSETEISELDPNAIYIIGGLVDHNRYKGLCERQARARGIATARLPIGKHVELASSAVLTVNHVFQALVEVMNHPNGDWATVLDSVLPKRKRAEYFEEQQVKASNKAKAKDAAAGAGGGGPAAAASPANEAPGPGATPGAADGADGAPRDATEGCSGAGGAEAGAAGAAPAVDAAAAAVTAVVEDGDAAAHGDDDDGEEQRGTKRKAPDADGGGS